MGKLNDAIKAINKEYGDGSVIDTSKRVSQKVDIISSGSIGLDNAIGVGGFPRGRMIEIYGKESSGKTTISIHAMAEAQKLGGAVAFIDAEHAFDKTYAEAIGVDVSKILISQPSCGEEALEITERLITTGEVMLIVIDSVAALVPKAEIAGSMGDSKMGLHARLMSQAMRKMTGVISKTNTCVIFINQLRYKISNNTWGSPWVTTGGEALKYYTSLRLSVSKTGTSDNKSGETSANQTSVKVVKNKLAAPFRVAKFDIDYGLGISKVGELLDYGVDHNVITKNGSWYYFNKNKIGQGRDNSKQFLLDNIELSKEIERRINDML